VRQAAKQSAARQARGSGAQRRAPEPRYLAVGQVIGVHGVHGELKVQILTDDPHRFGRLERVFVGPDGAEPLRYGLEHYRLHQKWLLLKLEGVDDREGAAALRGQLVVIPMEEAIPLEEGDVYVVQGISPLPREILIPAIAGVVQKVDLEAGQLIVELPEGLL